MSFVIPDVGEVQLLKYMLNFAPADNVRLHLYINDYTPLSTDTLANYTESAAYNSISLTGSQWTITTVLGTTTAAYATQTFSYTTAASVYGLYATNDGSTALLWAERFAGVPFTIPVSGGTVDVDPSYTLRSGTC